MLNEQIENKEHRQFKNPIHPELTKRTVQRTRTIRMQQQICTVHKVSMCREAKKTTTWLAIFRNILVARHVESPRKWVVWASTAKQDDWSLETTATVELLSNTVDYKQPMRFLLNILSSRSLGLAMCGPSCFRDPQIFQILFSSDLVIVVLPSPEWRSKHL